ncbi:hypothetical protein JB92DRAFT_3130812 [Gautieria morchelliformis]|nr:hypothetical protein JB92DRAFT_3130812 [Gautieria morchelliformis]
MSDAQDTQEPTVEELDVELECEEQEAEEKRNQLKEKHHLAQERKEAADKKKKLEEEWRVKEAEEERERSKAKSSHLRNLQGAQMMVQEPTEDDADNQIYSTDEDGEEPELTSDFELCSDSEEGEDDDDEFEAEMHREWLLKQNRASNERWAERRRKLTENGTKLISSFFAPKEAQQRNEKVNEPIEVSSDSSGDKRDLALERPPERISTESGSKSNFETTAETGSRAEASSSNMGSKNGSEAVLNAAEKVAELLKDLQDLEENTTDLAMGKLNWRNTPELRQAQVKLSVASKDKKIDVVFRGQITGMEASLLSVKAAGHGVYYARNLRAWIHQFLNTGELPMHQYGQYNSSILQDEDFRLSIQLHLQSVAKDGYIRAQDIVDYIVTAKMQERLGGKTTISVRTAHRWLHRMDWRYGRKKNGMYIDGHEQEDVVQYRKAFLARWEEYLKRMVTYDKEGNVASIPDGFPIPGGRCHLILVTHDESTFYANDCRKTKWTHSSHKSTPERKGDGVSLMVSDFLTYEWGRLRNGDEEARLVFKAGKNHDGYFTAEDLLKQVDHAIDIFEGKTKGLATCLFLFDNAPSHQK